LVIRHNELFSIGALQSRLSESIIKKKKVNQNVVYYIRLPYICFTLSVTKNTVIDAPPVAKWSIGKNVSKVIKYYLNKKAEISIIN